MINQNNKQTFLALIDSSRVLLFLENLHFSRKKEPSKYLSTNNQTMKQVITKYSLLLVLFLFTTTTNIYAGGPWPQAKGNAYIKISEWWIVSNQHYTDEGRIDPNLTNGIFNSSIYAEYGFTDRLTGKLYFPFFSRAFFNNEVSGTTGEILLNGEAINSLGDTDVSVTYGLLQGPLVVSASLTLGIPLGNDAGGSTGNLQTGDGEFNRMLQLDAGTGFELGKLSAYASSYIAYNNRTKGFSDEIRFGFEVGVTINKLTAIARLYGIQSRNNGIEGQRENSTSIFANNSEHLTFGPEIAYNIKDNWGLSAGFGTALSGKLIYAATSYSVGVFFKLDSKEKATKRRYKS